MEQKWATRRRNEELITFIKTKNDVGVMPSTRSIYEGVDMAKATTCKYLAVLRAEGVIASTYVGPTRLWHISKDDAGNLITLKLVFAQKKVEEKQKLYMPENKE